MRALRRHLNIGTHFGTISCAEYIHVANGETLSIRGYCDPRLMLGQHKALGLACLTFFIPSLDSAGFFAGLVMPSNCLSLTTLWTADAGFLSGSPGTFGTFNIQIGALGDSNRLHANVLESINYAGPELGDQGRWSVSVATPDMPVLLIGALACVGIKRTRRQQPNFNPAEAQCHSLRLMNSDPQIYLTTSAFRS